jgi:hypothetical protein
MRGGLEHDPEKACPSLGWRVGIGFPSRAAFSSADLLELQRRMPRIAFEERIIGVGQLLNGKG